MLITTTDNTRLHVTDHGGAGRPVVLVHAWGLTSRMWGSQVAALLDQGFRPVTLDRRGHGRSNQPAAGYDLDTLAADITTVLDTLDLHDVALAGHSMGGLEAVRVAAGPGADRVGALFLSAPTTPCLLHGPDNPGGLPAELFEGSRAVMAADLGAWIVGNTAGYWGADEPEGARPVDTAWTQQTIYATPLHVLLATNRTMVDADVRPDLARLTCPTLVVQGDADLSAPLPFTGQPTAALAPKAELVVLEGAGHGLYTSRAGDYNAHLLRFAAA